MTAIYAIILFVLMIFPHELGHFIVAKAVGVKVDEFAFGMGPAIFKKQGKETLYAIRIIPIGGYCAMEGENEESDNASAFNNKPGWAKISVLVAGSVMNVVIAILALSILYGVNGTPTTTIDKVNAESPAYEAGFQSGDEIVAIDGSHIENWSELSSFISGEKNSLEMTVLRDGKEVKITTGTQQADDGSGRYIIGIMPEMSHNVLTAAKNGTMASVKMVKSMYSSLKMLITGEVSATNITGPVGMISLVNDTNQYGMNYFIYLLALISLNLAIINMLPLPALDGGRILFVIIRKVTGKMISDDLEGKIHGIGMMLLFGLMIFATWNDITRLFL